MKNFFVKFYKSVAAFIKKFAFVFSTLFTLFVIALFYFTGLKGLKLYPVVVNFCIFFIFFSSLFDKETIIQKFARVSEGGGELHPKIKTYTKNLTYIWCVYLLFQFLFSFATLFMSDRVWVIFNGCVSYILLGLFFAIEYVFRIRFKKKHNLSEKISK